MKRLALLLIPVFFFSCSEEKSTSTVFEGTIIQPLSETLMLQGTNYEREIPITENTFSDTLDIPHNGFYDMYFGPGMLTLYLEQGKNLNISFDASQIESTIDFTGDLGQINTFLFKKNSLFQNNIDFAALYGANTEEFMAQLDADKKSLDSLYATTTLTDDQLKLFKKEDAYHRAILIEQYQEAHRYFSGNREFVANDNFYNTLNDIDFKDTTEFRNNKTYRELMLVHWTRVANQKAFGKEGSSSLIYMQTLEKELPNGYAKDELMYEHVKYALKADENLDEIASIFRNSVQNREYLDAIHERHQLLRETLPGNPSPSFSYENHKGGTTTLEDLRGKYVYIDVWATWCGPCLREIPSLQEVEKEYADKNIHIVSISIDEPKDYEKWRTMVTDRGMGGIQLMADNNWNSEFVKKYGIMGIPRFILLDTEGKIVSADTYRPSDPRLRELLNSILN
ncbi:MAG: TlpA family protein disulfide reductase [Bacteroidetes bacterium]|nr:TlpA family protein disulfide reductase [Bacteroidota bacterium]